VLIGDESKNFEEERGRTFLFGNIHKRQNSRAALKLGLQVGATGHRGRGGFNIEAVFTEKFG